MRFPTYTGDAVVAGVFQMTVIPEPTGISLLAAGVLAIAFPRFRMNR